MILESGEDCRGDVGVNEIAIVVPGLAVVVLLVVASWRLFEKAGWAGWAAIVPIYNLYVVLRIVGRPGYWLALMFIPLANIVLLIIVLVDLARSFGKNGGFAVLLILLPFIGFPLLAFGDATYRGPSVAPPGYLPPGYQQGGPQPGYPPQGYQQGLVQQPYPQQPNPRQGYPPPGYSPQQQPLRQQPPRPGPWR